MTRQRLLMAVVITLAVVATTACSLGVGAEPRRPEQLSAHGPLAVPFEHGYAYTSPKGVAVTDGLEIMKNLGTAPLTIESVTLVDSDGIKFLGAKLAPPPRLDAAATLIRSWPPVMDEVFDADSVVDAVGTQIDPSVGKDEMGWELLLGLRPMQEGRILRSAVRVVYTVGDQRYEAEFLGRITICTSSRYEIRGHCPDKAPGDTQPGD